MWRVFLFGLNSLCLPYLPSLKLVQGPLLAFLTA